MCHKGVVKRGVTERNARIVRKEDDNCRIESKNFHPQMEHFVAVNADSSHWDRCWSSLWVCAFLIQRMASKKFESRSLRENMRMVRAPFFAILDNFRKEFSPTEKDQHHLTILHDFHCERAGGDKTFGRKVDKWPTFCAKVQTARWVVRRLCQADVFPVKSDDELSEAVVMMAPHLSKFS